MKTKKKKLPGKYESVSTPQTKALPEGRFNQGGSC